jgi:hypothetical protein
MGYADGPVKPVSYGALSHEQYTKAHGTQAVPCNRKPRDRRGKF